MNKSPNFKRFSKLHQFTGEGIKNSSRAGFKLFAGRRFPMYGIKIHHWLVCMEFFQFPLTGMCKTLEPKNLADNVVKKALLLES